MADDTVSVIDQLQAGQPNTKPVDTSKVTRTDGSAAVAERQRMVVADDVFSDAKAAVTGDGLLRVSPTSDTIVQISGSVSVISDPTQPLPVQGNNVDDIRFVGGTPISLGAAITASSIPINIASDQIVRASLQSPITGTISSPDGGLATIGTTQDVASYGSQSGTEISQLRGMNDALQTLVNQQDRLIVLAGAILNQLNNVAKALNAPETILTDIRLQ